MFPNFFKKKINNVDLSEKQFLVLMVTKGYTIEEAKLQLKTMKTFGSRIMVGNDSIGLEKE
jgi:hypothetical protein